MITEPRPTYDESLSHPVRCRCQRWIVRADRYCPVLKGTDTRCPFGYQIQETEHDHPIDVSR
jgi:hypothetical protein